MGFKMRQIAKEDRICEQLTLEAITQVIPLEIINQVLEDSGMIEQRKRQLPARVVVLLCIAMNLFSYLSLSAVLRQLTRGTRLLSGATAPTIATKGAISLARYRLGSEPLQKLFEVLCRPIATSETIGAFAFGLRLVALDGSLDVMADTPENRAFFGSYTSQARVSAFPQVQATYLCECGTHVIFDAIFHPYDVSERVGGDILLRSIRADMLVMWDRGFHSYDMFVGVRGRGAQVLGRLPSHAKPRKVAVLPDGTWLGYLQPGDYQRRKSGEHQLLVRIIEYTIQDLNRPGYAQHFRLVTTLLDPVQYPALELVCLYHERWEVEMTIDELKTHQRLINRPLRSLKPEGVIQELYGLLLAHFVVRSVMHETACVYQLDPDRLSFTHSIQLLSEAIHDFQLVHPVQHAKLWQRLLHDIASLLLPERDNRSNPRVVKRKMSKFHLKRDEHRHWPQPTMTFREAVALYDRREFILN